MTTVIFINQIRMKIGVMFGSPETTTGGNALKFYASMRLDIRRRELIKGPEEAIGNCGVVKVVKNKFAPPFREAEIEIIWGKGINALADLVNAGLAAGVIEKSGAWLSYKDERLGQGYNNAALKLAGNDKLRVEIYDKVRKALLVD
jgi:recombination protein RecA